MHYRRRPLYALYVADSISLVGNAVAQLAIPWYVLTTTGSPALTGLAVFFNFLPVVLAGVFGGVIVDRVGFRATSIIADLASAAAVAAIPLLETTVGIELWQLMALVFLGALLDAPGTTARAALFPDVVELAGARMEGQLESVAAFSAARSSSAPHSAGSSSPSWAPRRLCGSMRRASSSPPRSSRRSFQQPAGKPIPRRRSGSSPTSLSECGSSGSTG